MTTSQSMPAPVVDALLRRPALLYDRMRREGPLQWSAKADSWIVLGYELARSVLRDDRFRMPGPARDSLWSTDPELNAFVRGMLLEAEGDDHDRLRRAVGPVFTPRALRSRMPAVTAAVDRILDGVASRTRLDGVPTISGRLPVDVVGDLVGIPVAERTAVSTLCRRISGGGGLAGSAGPTRDAVQDSVAALAELRGLVRGWLAEPGLCVPESVLAGLAGGPLSEPEAVAVVFSLYLAGHDTSRNLLSAVLLYLAIEARLLPALAAGEIEASSLVDRVLLVEAPLTFTARTATCDVELAGQLIRAGQRVRVMLGGANHELVRSGLSGGPLAGVAFGEGRHVCLGAHVARVEGTVLLNVLARRWRDVRLAGEPRWNQHFLHRGLAELPLEVRWRD